MAWSLPRRTKEGLILLTWHSFIKDTALDHRKVKNPLRDIDFFSYFRTKTTASFSKCSASQTLLYFCLSRKIISNSLCSYKSIYLYFNMTVLPRTSNQLEVYGQNQIKLSQLAPLNSLFFFRLYNIKLFMQSCS